MGTIMHMTTATTVAAADTIITIITGTAILRL
jgi:hypothetical protein